MGTLGEREVNWAAGTRPFSPATPTKSYAQRDSVGGSEHRCPNSDADIVKQAVKGILDTWLWNSTAAEAGVELAKAGKADSAVEVANEITDTAIRNETRRLLRE